MRAARGPVPRASHAVVHTILTGTIVNISNYEQRVLHALAQGGAIHHRRDATGRIVEALCVTRDGHVLTDGTLALFRKLKRRGLIASLDGRPYRISRLGLAAVRSQLDQR